MKNTLRRGCGFCEKLLVVRLRHVTLGDVEVAAIQEIDRHDLEVILVDTERRTATAGGPNDIGVADLGRVGTVDLGSSRQGLAMVCGDGVRHDAVRIDHHRVAIDADRDEFLVTVTTHRFLLFKEHRSTIGSSAQITRGAKKVNRTTNRTGYILYKDIFYCMVFTFGHFVLFN